MHRILSLVALVSLLLAGTARAQEEAYSTAIIPVVGSVTGLGGIRWSTDVTIRNQFGSSVTVGILLPGSPDEHSMILTLESGQTIQLNDVMRETFGVEGRLSPLVVRNEGKRSVIVSATVRGRGPGGEVRPQTERILHGELLPTRTFLQTLTLAGGSRTNVGLANIGDAPLRVTMALRRLSGRDLATNSMTLPPQSLTQLSLAALFPAVTRSEELTLVCEYYGTSGYAYASVLNNQTHNGTFVGP